MTEESNVYVKQLLAGRDHAGNHPVAGQMANFAYLVGCRETGQCLAVDPTWDPQGIVDIAAAEGLTVVGGVATHGHPDHVGGAMMGFPIPGIKELTEMVEGPIHGHSAEASLLTGGTGVAEDRLILHEEGDCIDVGNVQINVWHTPGHSPGSICLVLDGHVVTGDVLFVGACGRTDLPGADPRKMYESMQRLATLPEETKVWAGHNYGSAMESTIGHEKRTNPYLKIPTIEQWMGMMG